jgi:hypothetical protein
MIFRLFFVSISIFLSLPLTGCSQNTEKIIFNGNDSANDYYLAIPPLSRNTQGVQVLLTSFMSPEFVLSESKLQNVAYGNDLLTIVASMGQGLSADSSSVYRLNVILKSVIDHYSTDTSRFVLGALGYTGNIALRYTEMCYENPARFPVLPKAVFAINCPVDLPGLVRWCEAEIKKNYFPGNVGDAKYILDALAKKYGSYSDHPEKYIQVSPFYKDVLLPGNEQFLKKVSVRLYYDTDIAWEIKNHRNSYYDTYIPDGSEMIKRLLLEGNDDAEFISSRQPGIRSNGMRTAFSWSLPDEVDCIQWIKLKLKIFNPQTYSPTYLLPVPEGWRIERFSLPPEFAKDINFKGVEDVRFAPGWGDVRSEEYWTYAFLWWTEGIPELNTSILEKSLKSYYSGLIARNIPTRKIPESKLLPTVVNIHVTNTIKGDLETYSGTISMLDYMTQTPMVLNALIHKRNCPDKNHSYIFFEISPKPLANPLWQKLNMLYSGLECPTPNAERLTPND